MRQIVITIISEQGKERKEKKRKEKTWPYRNVEKPQQIPHNKAELSIEKKHYL